MMRRQTFQLVKILVKLDNWNKSHFYVNLRHTPINEKSTDKFFNFEK